MAYQYCVDTKHHCFFVKHVGEVTFAEVWQEAPEYAALPGYIKGMGILRDFTDAHFKPGYDLAAIKTNLKERPRILDEVLGHARKIAWVLGNADDFKTYHQFVVLARLNDAVIDRQAFRKMANAMAWLSIPDDFEIVYTSAEE